jgi:uncharacterized protein (TIGR03435 family)
MIVPIGVGFLLATCAAVAQTGGGAAPFEVASVKLSVPSKEGKDRVGVAVRGATVEANFTSLSELVRIAYRVAPYQVAGPDWTVSERFDVLAKMPEGASVDQMPEMLQTLLAERFQLTLHRESRPRAVYALLVGKDGINLRIAEPGADPPAANGAKTVNPLQLNRQMTLTAFADFLARFVDRPVIDMTGLKGTYQIAMAIPVEDLIKAKVAVDAAMRGGSDSTPELDGSPMFAAIRKFGLKLEPRKTAVDVLVIDHAEKRPTEN